MNDMEPINVPKIQKSKLGVRKPKGIDIKWSNPCGNQATHFVGYIESPNTKNSSYNLKKLRTTSYARPTIYISPTNERKTQVGWVVVLKQKVQR
jgi:endonuclease YncB( thermonuclease family)